MQEIRGFRGLRYAQARVGSLDAVVTPPWDVINPDQRRHLAQQSPYNMVHLMLPEPEANMAREEVSARNLRSWMEQGIFERDAEDSLYMLEQEYTDQEGYVQTRRGFLAVARLPEPGEDLVRGHERTFKGPVDNRLRLMRTTHANIEPVFVLYADPSRALASLYDCMDTRPPDAIAHTFEGTTHRLWREPHSPLLSDFFRDKILYIADGHHRFATAVAYRDEYRAQHPATGPEPYNYIMMGFVPFTDPGLQIYPPHRLLSTPEGFDAARFLTALETWFEVRFVDGDLHALVKNEPSCAFGLAIHGLGQYLLRLRPIDRTAMLGDDHSEAWRNLDVAVLHRGIIERILNLPPDTQFVYEHNAQNALNAVNTGEHGIAFLLRAIQSEEVSACADARDPMPQKATYFFPKLPSGMVLNPFI